MYCIYEYHILYVPSVSFIKDELANENNINNNDPINIGHLIRVLHTIFETDTIKKLRPTVAIAIIDVFFPIIVDKRVAINKLIA